METRGRHLLLEFRGCDSRVLNDRPTIQALMEDAARAAQATIVDSLFHTFSPQGVTGVVVVEESHFSIHTWPETGYAAVDVFTCGDHTMPEKACQHLRDELKAMNHALRSFLRETPSAVAEVERTPECTPR